MNSLVLGSNLRLQQYCWCMSGVGIKELWVLVENKLGSPLLRETSDLDICSFFLGGTHRVCLYGELIKEKDEVQIVCLIENGHPE